MKNIVIATIKPWNIAMAEQMKAAYQDGEVLIVTQKNDLTLSLLTEFQPEYIFFPHWSWLIPHEITANFCCVAFHMTDLPFGRGGSPLQNLIARGFTETKISAIRATDEVDAGDIFMKRPLDLAGTAEEIFNRAASIIFQDMIPGLLRERIKPYPQEGEITVFTRRTPAMSELSSDATLKECYDHIRMLDADGYPPAFLRYGNLRISFRHPKRTGEGIVAEVLIEEEVSDE
jgi:methionyl-tRNA formyltransferase